MDAVDEIVDYALGHQDPADPKFDPELHEALWRANQTEVFYEDNVIEGAPHLANIKFKRRNGRMVAERVDDEILSRLPSKNMHDWSLRTWKKAIAKDRDKVWDLMGQALYDPRVTGVVRSNVLPDAWDYLSQTFAEDIEAARKKMKEEKDQDN